MWKVINFSFNSAGIVIGALIGAASIAALIARHYGIELPEFPATVLGIYEKTRSYLFFWAPDWWKTVYSDAITFYLAGTFSQLRAARLYSTIFDAEDGFGPVYGGALLWPLMIVTIFFMTLSSVFLGKKKDLAQGTVLFFTFALTPIFAIILLQWKSLQSLVGF